MKVQNTGGTFTFNEVEGCGDNIVRFRNKIVQLVGDTTDVSGYEMAVAVASCLASFTCGVITKNHAISLVAQFHDQMVENARKNTKGETHD